MNANVAVSIRKQPISTNRLTGLILDVVYSLAVNLLFIISQREHDSIFRRNRTSHFAGSRWMQEFYSEMKELERQSHEEGRHCPASNLAGLRFTPARILTRV